MEQIIIPNLTAGFDHIRGLHASAAMLAVLVGDANRTRSIHWLRLSDGTEQQRFMVPLFNGAPDPAVSSDLTLIAYAEETDNPGYPHLVIESPSEPTLGRRTVLPPDPYGGDPESTLGCRYLAFNGDHTTLRASLDNGELAAWDIRNALGGNGEIALTEFSMEEYPPVRVLVHGKPPSLNGAEAHLIACAGAMLYLRTPNLDASPLSFNEGYNFHAHPQAAAFARDGKHFAVAFPDFLVVWGTENVARPPFRARIAVAEVQAVAFHTDNQLVTASADGTVRFWNIDGSGPMSASDWGIGEPGAIAYTPDGRVCILGGDGGRLALQRHG